MDEYISREATLKAFKLIAKNPNKDYQRGMQDTIDCLVPEVIADIPSADVQTVKCGRWIDIYEWAKMHDSTPSGMCTYYWCSECQKEQEKKSNFCPNCGAKMIEGDTENDTL